MNAWTVTEVNRAKALHEQGLTVAEIGIELNRGGKTVRDALNRSGVKLRAVRRETDPWKDYDRRVRMDAVEGSNQLLEAILRAGVRP